MPVVTPTLGFRFSINTEAMEKAIAAFESGSVATVNIYNDAKSPEGTYYWSIINNGRGPVRPVNAKALRWIDPVSGKVVFAQYSKGVPPVHMRENAIVVVQNSVIPGDFTGLDENTILRFVMATAEFVAREMRDRTPVRTGQLRDKYRIGE
jgi:hypothetical protein